MSSLFGAVEDMCLKKISKALEIVQIFFWLISGIFYSNDCVCDKKKSYLRQFSKGIGNVHNPTCKNRIGSRT